MGSGCVKTAIRDIVPVIESDMYREALYPWARAQPVYFIS